VSFVVQAEAGKRAMTCSVVINTYNRASSLPATLDGLTRQTYEDFEVVVVNGPSADGTAELLNEWSGRVRVVDLAAVHLGKSRNLGIMAAAGEVVAFIDDDAIPEPDWIESLVAAYDDPSVAGVGGLVFDHTGMELQYRYSVCSRSGHPRFDIFPPFDEYLYPGADPFLYLQGTNCSFRRSALVEIGGFDETIEYYLDETEVCMRLVDAGHRLVPLDGAAVHHRFLPSHLRTTRTVWTNPYPAVKNRYYFALANSRGRERSIVLGDLSEWVRGVFVNGSRELQDYGANDVEIERFHDRVHEGVAAGLELGLRAVRQSVEIGPPSSSEFLRFPTLRRHAPPQRFCFVSGEYAPDVGGIGRFTEETAVGLAGLGHEVHVVTRTEDHARIDVERGVWVHRVLVRDPYIPGLESSVLRHNLLHCAALYAEVVRLHERRPIDLVSAPIWNCENLLLSLDGRFPTVTSLHTTIRKVAELLPSWGGNPHIQALIRLELDSLRLSPILQANSRATVEETTGLTDGLIELLHYGLTDAAPNASPLREAGDGTELLFVGRLERRKGVDVLLDAAPALLDRLPDLHLTLVGRDTTNTEIGTTYRERFQQEHSGAEFLNRVHFVGEVADDELARRYAACDVLCVPSRYESFGFVVLEGMAHGKPVVASAAGGMTDLVDGNGILVPPEEVADLAEALDRVLRDPGLRESMGRRGRQLFEEFWELSAAIHRTEQAYVSFAASGSTGEELSPSRLAPVLIDAGLDADDAPSVAAALIDPSNYPHNVAGELVRLLVSDDHRFVDGLYRLLRDREPEQWELDVQMAFLARGGSRLVVAGDLAADPWAPSRLGAGWRLEVVPLWGQALADAVRWFIADPDDSHVVTRLYETVLFRTPSSDELRSVVEALHAGVSRAELLHSLVVSDEARAKQVPTGWLSEVVGPPPTPGSAGQGDGGVRTVGATARQLRQRLSELRSAVRSVPRMTGQLGGLQSEVAQVEQRLSELSESLTRLAASDDRPTGTEVSPDAWDRSLEVDRLVAARLSELTSQQSELTSQQSELTSQQHQGFDQLIAWIDVLQRKQEGMALDLRERLPVDHESLAIPEPKILEPSGWDELVKRENGLVRLNLGCGEKPKAGYVNVDARPLEGVDVVGDVRRLPVPPGSADEVCSEHLIEHFRLHELETVVLPYWRSLLRPGGSLRIVCPDASALIQLVASGRISFEQFRTATFGLQDYSGDDHFAMYDAPSLTEMLERVGFVHVEVVEVGRRNVGTHEMELTAVNPGNDR